MLVHDKRTAASGCAVSRTNSVSGFAHLRAGLHQRPARLVGDRKMGLIKYVMSLVNAARLGIGAQSVGLCEAAYREALKYAQERAQFGKPIIQFAAVAEMLSNMKAKLQGARALLYETTRFVEIYKQYGHIAQERSLEPEERQEMKFYNRLADGFHAAGKALRFGVCQPARLRCGTDSRRFGLHEGLSLRTPSTVMPVS